MSVVYPKKGTSGVTGKKSSPASSPVEQSAETDSLPEITPLVKEALTEYLNKHFEEMKTLKAVDYVMDETLANKALEAIQSVIDNNLSDIENDDLRNLFKAILESSKTELSNALKTKDFSKFNDPRLKMVIGEVNESLSSSPSPSSPPPSSPSPFNAMDDDRRFKFNGGDRFLPRLNLNLSPEADLALKILGAGAVTAGVIAAFALTGGLVAGIFLCVGIASALYFGLFAVIDHSNEKMVEAQMADEARKKSIGFGGSRRKKLRSLKKKLAIKKYRRSKSKKLNKSNKRK
jgi:hypothetical protein